MYYTGMECSLIVLALRVRRLRRGIVVDCFELHHTLARLFQSLSLAILQVDRCYEDLI